MKARRRDGDYFKNAEMGIIPSSSKGGCARRKQWIRRRSCRAGAGEASKRGVESGMVPVSYYDFFSTKKVKAGIFFSGFVS